MHQRASRSSSQQLSLTNHSWEKSIGIYCGFRNIFLAKKGYLLVLVYWISIFQRPPIIYSSIGFLLYIGLLLGEKQSKLNSFQVNTVVIRLIDDVIADRKSS